MATAWGELKTTLIAAGPALLTMLGFAYLCAKKRGMLAIAVPNKRAPWVEVPFDLLLATLTLAFGFARKSPLHLSIGLGAFAYYLSGQVQMLALLPREAFLYEMERRSMLAALACLPEDAEKAREQVTETFQHNVRNLCPNLPRWQKGRIDKIVAKNPWPGPGKDRDGFIYDPNDEIANSQRQAVQIIFDSVDRSEASALRRYEMILAHLRDYEANNVLLFSREVQRMFMEKLDQLSSTMDADDVEKAAEMLDEHMRGRSK